MSIRWLVEWKDGTTWRILDEFESPDPRKNEFQENGKLQTLGGIMEGQKGHALYFAHDANYRAWVIRAGSKP